VNIRNIANEGSGIEMIVVEKNQDIHH